jgi:radical SAM superfamily enzyme YgiQ (UPF0313 family)
MPCFVSNSQTGRTPVYLVTDTVYKCFPLALGMIQAFLQVYKKGVLKNRIEFIPMYNCETGKIIEKAAREGAGIWLFSNYIWSIDKCLEVSRRVKMVDPDHITIHGGPSIPKYPEASRKFLEKNTHVDIAVIGEGELTCAELIEHILGRQKEGKNWRLDLNFCEGIRYLDFKGEWISTPERSRIADLNQLPSPLLSGCFDHLVTSANSQRYESIPLSTNRGCPYSCAFCDWGGATHQNVCQFDMERVKSEIQWIAQNRIPHIMIIDANSGQFNRDVDIIEYIARIKSIYGYPKEVTLNYGKNNIENVQAIKRTLIQADINSPFVIAIQTRCGDTLKTVRRVGIKTENFDRLQEFSNQESIPITADLILGLPGATLKSFMADLQFYYDRHVQVNAYLAQMIENSPMNDPAYREKYRLRTDKKGHLVACFSYSEREYRLMVSISTLLVLFDSYGILKYFLRFLDWDYEIRSIDFIHSLSVSLGKGKLSPYRFLTMLYGNITNLRFVCNFVSQNRILFFEEILKFTADTFGLDTSGADFETVVSVNQAVIPDPNEDYPLRKVVDHDYISYYHAHVADAQFGTRLSDYPQREFEVVDRFGLSKRIMEKARWKLYGGPQEIYFELESPLMAYRLSPKWRDDIASEKNDRAIDKDMGMVCIDGAEQ